MNIIGTVEKCSLQEVFTLELYSSSKNRSIELLKTIHNKELLTSRTFTVTENVLTDIFILLQFELYLHLTFLIEFNLKKNSNKYKA